jgi:hypothetical protein
MSPGGIHGDAPVLKDWAGGDAGFLTNQEER